MSIADDAEGDITVKAVLGEKKSDVVEAKAAAVAVTSTMSAAAVASAVAVAAPDVVSVGKKGVSGSPLSFA